MSHLYGIPATGLRFFTVYGPWGRPDMAMYIFAKAITEGQPIRLFNNGCMRRDFTYVDDVITAVEQQSANRRCEPLLQNGLPASIRRAVPRQAGIHNIGNGRTAVAVSLVVELLERELGRKAITELAPMQPGDVPETCADVDDLMRDAGFRPSTSIEEGVRRFAAWYREYHKR